MPLKGIKVIELAGLAPGPFCGMILADFGASVVRVDKPEETTFHEDVLANGKRSIAIDLKNPRGAEVLKKITSQSDVIIDPFRKGVMEKLKLGPKDLTDANERLIYARLTGFGQDGCYSNMAGHDINYVGISGLLSLFGRKSEKPTPPVNFAADFAGGGLICALGIVLALFERARSNVGQVIDASMVEGSAYLGSWLFRTQNLPFLWSNERGRNLLDTGAHFYETYETKDGKYMSVGAIEPKFYKVFMQKLGRSSEELPHLGNFEENKEIIGDIFKRKTQQEWCDIFDGTDACVTPVLSLKNANRHAHNAQRESFETKDDLLIPKPAPRLSRTPGKTTGILAKPEIGEHSVEILREFGFSRNNIDELVNSEIVHRAKKRAKL